MAYKIRPVAAQERDLARLWAADMDYVKHGDKDNGIFYVVEECCRFWPNSGFWKMYGADGGRHSVDLLISEIKALRGRDAPEAQRPNIGRWKYAGGYWGTQADRKMADMTGRHNGEARIRHRDDRLASQQEA